MSLLWLLQLHLVFCFSPCAMPFWTLCNDYFKSKVSCMTNLKTNNEWKILSSIKIGGAHHNPWELGTCCPLCWMGLGGCTYVVIVETGGNWLNLAKGSCVVPIGIWRDQQGTGVLWREAGVEMGREMIKELIEVEKVKETNSSSRL